MIAILGGGISGLTAAYQLKKQNKPFILLEASKLLGGKVGTYQEEGFTCELGPNTVLINNPEIKSLLEDLNLWSAIIYPEEKAIKSRFVLKNSNIEAIPTSFSSAIKSKLIGINTLFSILKEPFIPAKKGEKEESLADFSRRRFGTQIFDDLITPFITGIYAGDPEKMSIDYTLSMLREAEKKHGSVLKGMINKAKQKKQENSEANLPKQKVFSFPKGLQDLINALGNEVVDSVSLNSEVLEIKKTESGFLINYQEGEAKRKVEVDQIISALPSFSLAKAIQNEDEYLANQLRNINYTNAVVLHLGYLKKDVGFNQEAFGILSRKAEKVPFLGVLFNSRFFPHTSADSDKELITVICGGSRYPELIRKNDSEILQEVIESLKDVLNINGKPIFSKVIKWGNGIPQYELGYADIEKAMNNFQDKNPGIHLLGNYYKGISVSDCIKNAIHLTSKLN